MCREAHSGIDLILAICVLQVRHNPADDFEKCDVRAFLIEIDVDIMEYWLKELGAECAWHDWISGGLLFGDDCFEDGVQKAK
jgi:hypothetical protein